MSPVFRLPLIARLAFPILAVLFCATAAKAQQFDLGELGAADVFGNAADAEATVSATLIAVDPQTAELKVTVKLPDGYYTYSMNKSFEAATSITLSETSGLKESGEWTSDRAPKAAFDKDFGKEIEKFYDTVTWTKKLTGTLKEGMVIKGQVDGQFCGNGTCRQYDNAVFAATLTSTGGSASNTSENNSATSDSAEASVPDQTTAALDFNFGTTKAPKKGILKVDVSVTPEDAKPGDEVTLTLKATIQDPYHTFALDQDPEMAGLPTEIEAKVTGLTEVDSAFNPSKSPEEEKPLPDIIQRVHYGEITWTRKYKVSAADVKIEGSMKCQVCRDGTCLKPTTEKFTLTFKAKGDSASRSSENKSTTDTNSTAGTNPAANGTSDTTSNADASEKPSVSGSAPREGIWAFVLAAVGAGFAALATPCVFPMIPITVAFFLKQEEKKAGSSMGLAIVYCLSIVGAFTILGVLTAAIFGANTLTDLANGTVLNLFFAVLFLLFAFILLGLINVQIPSWLLTWTSKREAAGGLAGVVFMALTFTLVSFTCTFAFVGGLLVVAAQGDYLWPIIGMLCFSTAFASPFFILAMFPRLLKNLPRSGGWMEDVKIVIGLIELGAVAKFLSVADVNSSPTGTPRFITYGGFLWAVVALCILAVVATLGFFNRSKVRRTAPARLFFAAVFTLLGARIAAGVLDVKMYQDPVWNVASAFAPPEIQDGDVTEHPEFGFALSFHGEQIGLEFDRAVSVAQKSQKLLFVDITGVNCVNCRKMERTVLVDPRVTAILAGTVQAQLYVDRVPGIRDQQRADSIKESNNKLAINLLGDVTMPAYAVLTPDGKKVLSVFKSLDSSGGEDFLKFLNAGISKWEKLQKKTDVATRN